MIKLFWRAFLGFWLATTLIVVGTALVIHEMEPNGFPRPPKSRLFNQDPQAMRLLQIATRDAVNSTQPEFIQQLKSMPFWMQRSIFAVNAQGQELLDRTPPKAVSMLAEKLDQRRPFKRLERDHRQYFGRLIQLQDGSTIRLVVLSPDDKKNIFLQLFLMNFWPILLIAILISGTLCFFLARNLSRPIEALKTATQKIAAGELNYRVGPIMGNRKDELGSLAADFDQMSERLESAMTAQQRLIKDVSHELRSPLMRLQFALGLAQQKTTGEASEDINKARLAADYLNNIISDILSIPINTQEPWPLEDSIDVEALLKNILEELQPTFAKKQVALQFTTKRQDPALVATRGNILLGVFDNILSNALRHTPEQSTIHVNLKQSEDDWIIDVRDQGLGVSSAQLEEIFAPFYRTDEARDRMRGGVGLGLSIAKRTIALHKGKIRALHNQPSGLHIEIKLPILR
ncbi:ATP-binding protein [Simiduia litorea]|uniref:ATP-binding protein n=1 Tax=Simiduia litorea TaxID=1435348 RepID=UPI0036F1DAAC